ncbi:MAG: AI-2E family transporter [Gemmatimonadaceae bacterium]|nr:AI-2E family transporter [Gemmatimonadaceae bacterium]
MQPRSDRGESALEPDVDVGAPAVAPLGADQAVPDIDETGAALGTLQGLSTAVWILAVLAVIYTIYFAREFLLPIVFAVLLNFLLSPVIRLLSRLRISPPFGALIVILGMLAAVGLSGYELAGPVERFATDAPATLSTAEARLTKLLKPLQRASKTAEQVANAATATAGGSSPSGSAKPTQVVVAGPSLITRFFGTTQRVVGAILEVTILLYFLLAAGDLFLQKLIKVLPGGSERKLAVQIARETEASISTYLLTTSLVNAVEGVVVALIMWAWGMPSPILWGLLVFALEFIPYLGALAMSAILMIAALTTFDSVGHALLVPGSFIAVNLIQGNFVSPILLGHRLALNPVALFVGLAFWFWVWGIPGAFIAVPLVATFKIFCDHIGVLASIGEFLGQRDDEERRALVRVSVRTPRQAPRVS